MSPLVRNNSPKGAMKVATPSPHLLDCLASLTPEGIETIQAFRSYMGSPDWDGLKVVPPGSFLEEIIELFRRETDIPLELPMVAALSIVSGYLNALGAKYEISGSLYAPKLWTVVLAASGSGKTFATDKVESWLTDADGKPVVPALQSASSAAQFVANIQQVPKGLMVRDEFGQFLNQIQHLRHMEEIKDILLQAFSGGDITRMTKEAQIIIQDHAFSILGITVGETFGGQIGAESLVDGFAQRFNFIHADRDPARQTQDFPIYFENWDCPAIQTRYARLRSDWLDLLARTEFEDAIFSFCPQAIGLFKDSFRTLFVEAEIPASFYRRAMFSAFSYAVVFHAIAGNQGTMIERDSMSLAVRMVALHLDHARRLLNNYGLSDLEKTVQKAETIRDRLKAQGRPLKARDLVSGIREIKSAPQAHSIMSLMS
ncbi:DUF3987 domain-containing protein [Ruegeria arenilitoris]|uniref:DUF3987 domain-containing protein n=1 Tax=Ruegeria arenilitoris TaxID=1173585 RepID=A0A238KG32_9RHOB|nr:DUF3987 domain-containing protein [Ruegeria arenilitoris]SMX41768.1 hypothetical protein RUA8715_02095 [Ruegeria arenilitoris]